MSTKPKAIELADWSDWFCKNVNDAQYFRWQAMKNMSAELRRLHAENQELKKSHRILSDDEIWDLWEFPRDLSWKESVIALVRKAQEVSHES